MLRRGLRSLAVLSRSAAAPEDSQHCAALLAALSSRDPDASLRGLDFVPSAFSLGKALERSPSANAALQCFAWASGLPGFRHGFQACNALLVALIKNGRHREAHGIFDSQLKSLAPPDASSYGILANAYVQAGDLDAAVKLLRDLPASTTANLATYLCVMMGLCRGKRSIDAIGVLREMQKRNVVPELATYLMLIEGLGRDHRVKEAFDLFQEIHARGFTAKASSYSYIVCGLAKYGYFDEAVELFEEMIRRKVAPPLGSCIGILNGYCQDGGKMEQAIQLFRKMEGEYGCPPNTYAYNVLLTGLKKKDRVEEMREMFLEMKEKGCEPNLVTYCTYILGLCKAGRVDDAMVVKKEMIQKSCSPDNVVYSILINAFCKVGKIYEGEKLLAEMLEKKLQPDVVCFSSLVDCLDKAGRYGDAYRLFRRMMEQGCKPDAVIASVILDSFTKRGEVAQALELVNEFVDRDLPLPSAGSINQLVKRIVVGDKVEDGVRLLKTMASRGSRPLQCSYATLLRELCRRKNAVEALELVKEMRAAGYTSVDLSCVIEMLCKMKMVDEARGLYEEMKSSQQQELLPSVSTYNILLERLCGEGRLGDAKDLFQEMIESGRIPDVNSYEILVEALCKAGKIFQGHELFKQLISLGFIPSSEMCATIVDGLCKHQSREEKSEEEDEDDAEEALREMIDSGFVPDDVIGDVIRELEARKKRRNNRNFSS
ncbi:pentatricopeptide repeat-containing protein At1g63400 [Selaginella moellendorffii]|nr:pentatricopeptide repeat-containing protein At1g63400 [Selaginella moellendorffii]|eukprot:XP_002962692.2 pentatricopeptide repeat-containing protein At1g63400 [Selaginella moellendorffii]